MRMKEGGAMDNLPTRILLRRDALREHIEMVREYTKRVRRAHIEMVRKNAKRVQARRDVRIPE